MQAIVAHRGASGYAPENTISAFELAISFGVHSIELDVQLSKDGEIVVIHDNRLERTTSGIGFVKDYSLKELKRLDAGSWFSRKYKGERIPTLQEVFDFIKGRVFLFIELKNAPIKYKWIEKKVVKLIEQNGLIYKTAIISFDHNAVLNVKKYNKQIKTGIIYYSSPVNHSLDAQKAKAEYLICNHHFITRKIVKDVHKANLKILAWNVATSDEIKRIIETGVDAIASNYPDKVKNFFYENIINQRKSSKRWQF